MYTETKYMEELSELSWWSTSVLPLDGSLVIFLISGYNPAQSEGHQSFLDHSFIIYHYTVLCVQVETKMSAASS